MDAPNGGVPKRASRWSYPSSLYRLWGIYTQSKIVVTKATTQRTADEAKQELGYQKAAWVRYKGPRPIWLTWIISLLEVAPRTNNGHTTKASHIARETGAILLMFLLFLATTVVCCVFIVVSPLQRISSSSRHPDMSSRDQFHDSERASNTRNLCVPAKSTIRKFQIPYVNWSLACLYLLLLHWSKIGRIMLLMWLSGPIHNQTQHHISLLEFMPCWQLNRSQC